MTKYCSIGTIVGTHALKGEVKISSTTDFREERYKKGSRLFINKDNEMIEVKVQNHRFHKGNDLVLFENYNDINKVLPFVNCEVFVHEDDLQPLAENEYYYHELFDCEVYYQDEYIGIVTDIVNYGASDILVVKKPNDKEVMIPFVNDFIIDVDIKNKRIQIEVIEGLLENEN